MALPFLKSAGTSVLKMGKKILPGLVSDVVGGKRKWSESLKHRGTAALMDVLEEREDPRPPKSHVLQGREKGETSIIMMRRDACECSKAQLDLFTVPPVSTSVQEGQWIRYSPLAPPSVAGPLQFNISNPVNAYIDLKQCYLRVCLRVTKDDGTDTVLADNPVSTVNNVMHSLFREVRLQVGHNQLEITPSMGTYPYRAYLETLLSYGTGAKTSHLRCPGWFTDDAGKMDVFNPDADANTRNTGVRTRRDLIVPTKEVELTGRLHCDLFLQDRYLLDGVPMKLELLRSPDEFFFICAADGAYKLALTKAEFYVRQLNIDPAVRETHVSSLNAGVTAKYPLSRVHVTADDIPRGGRDFHKDHLIGGQLPKHVVLGLVDNSAYVGSKEKNPYNFKHNHVTMMKLKVNGQEVHGTEMKSDFSNNSANLKQVYMNLFRNTGQLWRPETCELTPKAFTQGYTLWVVDLTPDLGADEGINYPRHTGKLALEIQFGQALEDPATLICYEEYENVLEIDRFRNAMMV
ncbi:uncharacterized protein F54H12.2-like [Haliotis cracherodii]|uniref:uncharacterized protein F54H12.2-like n=1 Tax=Haliotis cracherodii TaxID=6455 RepID=UPI0039EABD11